MSFGTLESIAFCKHPVASDSLNPHHEAFASVTLPDATSAIAGLLTWANANEPPASIARTSHPWGNQNHRCTGRLSEEPDGKSGRKAGDKGGAKRKGRR